MDWDLQRNNSIFSLGKANSPGCNPEFYYDISNQELKIRLTNNIISKNIVKLNNNLNKNDDKLSEKELKVLHKDCKYLNIHNVKFNYHKDRANQQLLKVLNNPHFKTPLSYRIIKKKLNDNKAATDSNIGYYLQIMLNDEIFNQVDNSKYNLDKSNGILGVDFNAKGVAWCIVKLDGNRLVEIINKESFDNLNKSFDNLNKSLDNLNKSLDNNNLNKSIKTPACGFIPWELFNNNKPKSTQQCKWIIENTCIQIARLAVKYNVAIAIENLDFSAKKLSMKSGYIDKKYNQMLSSMATTKFHSALTRCAHKKLIDVYVVNPCFSSVGGFVKYGMINKVGVDIAASHWLARQALYGKSYKIDENIKYIKLHKEAMKLVNLSTTANQRKTCTDELTFSFMAKILGPYRHKWRNTVHELIFMCNLYDEPEIKTDPKLTISNLSKNFNPFEDTVSMSEFGVRTTQAILSNSDNSGDNAPISKILIT